MEVNGRGIQLHYYRKGKPEGYPSIIAGIGDVLSVMDECDSSIKRTMVVQQVIRTDEDLEQGSDEVRLLCTSLNGLGCYAINAVTGKVCASWTGALGQLCYVFKVTDEDGNCISEPEERYKPYNYGQGCWSIWDSQEKGHLVNYTSEHPNPKSAAYAEAERLNKLERSTND